MVHSSAVFHSHSLLLGRGLGVGSFRSFRVTELFNDWGGRGYDDSVPGEVT